jgi:hypothetical protein
MGTIFLSLLARQEIFMKNQQFLVILALIAIALSCNLPMQRTTWTNITSVAVTPSSGEKVFNLEVKYQYTWYREYPNVEIYCMYTTPSGRTIPIGSITPEGLDRDREFFSKSQTLAFTVKPKDGKIELGVYLAGCATEHDVNMVTTTFIVVESVYPDPTPTPPLESATVPIMTQQTPILLLKGKIVFDYAKVESSRPGAGGELSRVTDLCVPEITFGTGNIGGQCEKLHITAFMTDESITAQVTGLVDSSGNVTFYYDVSDIGNPNGAWRISYEGQGKFTSATQAAGTATFSYSCNSGSENLIWCWQWTSESFSGTILWSFVQSP